MPGVNPSKVLESDVGDNGQSLQQLSRRKSNSVDSVEWNTEIYIPIYRREMINIG